jgi:hypothetical protein
VEIDVTFEINADGIVSVHARDLETGKEQSITVTATSGLTKEEVSNMMDHARSTRSRAAPTKPPRRPSRKPRRSSPRSRGSSPRSRPWSRGATSGATPSRRPAPSWRALGS